MEKILITAMKLMKVEKNSEVSLLLTDDKEIRNLNKSYRNIDSPTDVLSFSMNENKSNQLFPGDIDEYLLGDIVISIETAEKQAKNLDHSLDFELTTLLIHGLLHLIGFDHIKEKDFQRMKEEENRITALLEKTLD